MAAPVEDDIVDELIVGLPVVGIGAHAVEAGRAAHAVADEAVVHGAVLAAPLHAVGALALDVLRVVEALGRYTPLHGGGVAVVERQVLLHRPRQRAVVEHHVVGVLHVEGRHAVGGQVA